MRQFYSTYGLPPLEFLRLEQGIGNGLGLKFYLNSAEWKGDEQMHSAKGNGDEQWATPSFAHRSPLIARCLRSG